MTESPPARRSRKQFWALVAVFFAPLLLAFLLYYGVRGWRPAGSTNHGDLIHPARPLPQTTLVAPDNTTLPPDLLQGKWTLVYIGPGQCDEACRAALVHMRQSRLALSDEMQRVARLFLATGDCCNLTYLQSEHPGLLVARADTPAAQEVLSLFPSYAGQAASDADRIYIVDPLGNLMMSYAPDAPPRGLLEDLKKLLKLSHIG